MGAGRNLKKRDIAPGIWEDEEGNPHIDVPALLQIFGLEETEENKKVVMDGVEKMLKARFPEIKVIQRLVPD